MFMNLEGKNANANEYLLSLRKITKREGIEFIQMLDAGR
jgi:hypothetical protein